VSDYRLHDRSSIPGTGNRFLSSLCVQTSTEAHPASYPTDTGGKARPKRDADHSPPSSVEVKNKQELCHLFPRSLHGVAWQLCFILTTVSCFSILYYHTSYKGTYYWVALGYFHLASSLIDDITDNEYKVLIKYNFGAAFIGMISMPNLMRIHP
jgi:hypothetical protein